jgi:hypothetical protein
VSQIFFSLTAIFCFGQDKAMITLNKTLSIGENREFVRIEEVASDRHGNIYVTDAYKYNIKKFSPTGTLLGEYGKRGNDSSDFGAPPYKIIYYNDTLAIVTKGTSRVQLFTEYFKYISQFSLPGTIIDIIFDHRGRIVAGIIPNNQNEHRILFLLDRTGKTIASSPSHKIYEGPAFDMMHLSEGKNNTIIVGYRFTNTIALYTDELKLINIFSVPGLPPESPYTIGSSIDIGKIPEGDVIKDIGTEPNGNIFILSGECNDIPNRAVFLFEPEGIYLARFQLPQKSGILYFDNNGNMYTREEERSVLRRYSVTYHKK